MLGGFDVIHWARHCRIRRQGGIRRDRARKVRWAVCERQGHRQVAGTGPMPVADGLSRTPYDRSSRFQSLASDTTGEVTTAAFGPEQGRLEGSRERSRGRHQATWCDYSLYPASQRHKRSGSRRSGPADLGANLRDQCCHDRTPLRAPAKPSRSERLGQARVVSLRVMPSFQRKLVQRLMPSHSTSSDAR